MNQFAVSPEDCLLLKTINETSSLREAAALLQCDPAGLTRRIQKLAEDTGFIQKVGLRWKVSSRGLDLIAWVNEALQTQEKLLNAKQTLRIGAMSWFAEEVLIPHLSTLKKQIGSSTRLAVLVPEKGLELALIDGSVDFVTACHPPENPEIEHRALNTEEWCIVIPQDWETEIKKNSDVIAFLQKKPFVRHLQLNLDLFLPEIQSVTESGFCFDTLAAVRTAVRNGLGWSLVPKFLIRYEARQKNLLALDYKLDIKDRKVCLWWLRNRIQHKKLSAKLAVWLRDICN